MCDYRNKGKLALNTIIDDIEKTNTLESILFNQSLTTDEYNIFILESMRTLRVNGYENLIDDIEKNNFMYQNDRFDSIREKISEYDKFIIKPFEVDEGVLTCHKCNSNKTFSYTKQTRSGDEATTVFAVCTNCNARWTT